MRLGADTDPFVFTLTVSAGGVLIATLVGLWIRDRRKRKGDE